VDREGEESPFAEVRRMLIKMFNDVKEKLKGDIQNKNKNNSMQPKRTWIKYSRRHRNN
jgi:hypothetical protein